MPRQRALVTGSVMKWAREKAGYDPATAADKIKRPVEEIEAWEDGSLLPSLAQARKAAQVYKLSLSVFYLPEPPEGYAPLRDFRHLPEGIPSAYSPELSWVVRQVRARQEWLAEFLRDERSDVLSFVGSARQDRNPRQIAEQIRHTLGVPPEEQLACEGRREALNLWIQAAEDAGVSVCRQAAVDCEEARGFALCDEHAPFIFINSKDAIAGQLFTLAHELAHVWTGQPGISNLEALPRTPSTRADRTEVFCNRIAAELLLEDILFRGVWDETEGEGALETRIAVVSNRFRVSDEVIARRLLELDTIDFETYQRFRSHYQQRWHEQRERQKAPGGHYYYTQLAKNGRLFTRTVLSACRSTAITIADATGLLGVKANNLPKLATYAGVVLNW